MRPKHTMPDGDVYRRLIIRNLVCTVAICATYLITTVVVVAALLEQSPENSTVRSTKLRVMWLRYHIPMEDCTRSTRFGWGSRRAGITLVVLQGLVKNERIDPPDPLVV